jgi:hypothetical protein
MVFLAIETHGRAKGKLQYQFYTANPSTDYFQTLYVALPWVIYSPYISRFCGDQLTTKASQSLSVWPIMISGSDYIYSVNSILFNADLTFPS